MVFYLADMKYFLLLSFAIGFFLTEAYTAPTEEVKEILTIKTSEHPLTKGIQYLSGVDIYNSKLYLVYEQALLNVDLRTGVISRDMPMSTYLNKRGKAVRKITVPDSLSMYLFYDDEVCFKSARGKVSTCFSNPDAYIYDYFVDGDFMLIPTSGFMVLYNVKQKKVIKRMPYEFRENNYVTNPNGIVYSDFLGTYEFTRKGTTIQKQSFATIEDKISSIENPFIVYSNARYRICLSFTDRSKIYVIKQDQKTCEVVRILNLNGKDYTPSNQDIRMEGWTPNFRVVWSNGIYYAIILNNEMLTVLSFKL